MLPFRDAYAVNRWLLASPHALSVRYEDLVGPLGGGSADRQHATVTRVLEHLGVSASVPALCDGLYGGTKTFSVGRVDDWRDHFDDHALQRFEELFGDILDAYGYERVAETTDERK